MLERGDRFLRVLDALGLRALENGHSCGPKARKVREWSSGNLQTLSAPERIVWWKRAVVQVSSVKCRRAARTLRASDAGYSMGELVWSGICMARAG